MFCRTLREAENAAYDIMVAKLFGASGDKIDIEEFVKGEMVTVTAFSDGTHVVPLTGVENYRRVFDGNLGMSTAGMGASLPAKGYTEEVEKRVYDEIIMPTINALKEEGCEYKGALAFSIIVAEDGSVKVVDFVSRLCDVEGQVLIPLIETPLLDIFNAVIDGTLDKIEVKIKHSSGVCVVATSGGYPLEYTANHKITIADQSLMESGRLGSGAYCDSTVTIDDTAPEILSIYKDLVTNDLVVTAKDNQYIAAVVVNKGTGTKRLAAALPEQTAAGQTTTTALEMPQYTSEYVTVTVADYAGNSTSYKVRYNGEVEDSTGKLFAYTRTNIRGSGPRWMMTDPDTLAYRKPSASGLTTYDSHRVSQNGLDLMTP